jgi:hypothetical protein
MENYILTKYIHEYNKINKRRKHNGKRGYVLTHKTNKLIEALRNEKHFIRKCFVDTILNFLESGEGYAATFGSINKNIFKMIIMPILIAEYKNNQPKYIKWIGQLDQFIYIDKEIRSDFFKGINCQYDFTDTLSYQDYFLCKSFLIDKNPKTLDLLLSHSLWIVFFIYSWSFPNTLSLPRNTKYSQYEETLESFENIFKKRKHCYELSDYKKPEWKKIIDTWELLILYLHKFEDRVKNNGFIRFSEYLKENNMKDIIEISHQENMPNNI